MWEILDITETHFLIGVKEELPEEVRFKPKVWRISRSQLDEMLTNSLAMQDQKYIPGRGGSTYRGM